MDRPTCQLFWILYPCGTIVFQCKNTMCRNIYIADTRSSVYASVLCGQVSYWIIQSTQLV